MHGLLEAESAPQAVSATLINVHSVLEQRLHLLVPLVVLDLVTRIVKRRPPPFLCDERICLLHQQQADDGRGADLLRLRYSQMKWSDSLRVLQIYVRVTRKQERECKLILVIGRPMHR